MSERPRFRTDINALRAYAVAFVALYHFGVPGFQGGFVGVDVFFVLSGYLMTRIILNRNPQQEPFLPWLKRFYLARIQRIVPALIALCGSLLAIGYFTLPSMDYKQLATHAITSLAFASNIKFWLESGYFDVASHDKWLLHTWSLSVEWQFYLLFPLFIYALTKWSSGRDFITGALAIAFLLSLAASIWFTITMPTAAFFLLPTRAWEFLAGGLVHTTASGWIPKKSLARILEAGGFVLLIMSATTLDGSVTWPGALALIPTLGTVLVILATRDNSAWTTPTPIQRVGAWSYSIYLWHWPIVVALAFMGVRHEPLAIVAGIGASIILGFASYALVESRTRLPKCASVRRVLLGLTVTGVTIVGTAGIIRLNDGVPGRLSPEVELVAAEATNINPRQSECHSFGGLDFKRCVYGGDTIAAILVGDSHATSVATALAAALPEPHQGLLTFTYTSCPTIFNVQMRNRPDLKCAEFNEWVMTQTRSVPTDVPIIIVNRTSAYLLGDHRPSEPSFGQPLVSFEEAHFTSPEELTPAFSRNLVESACRFAATRPTILMRPIPEMPWDVPRFTARMLITGRPIDIRVSLEEYHARHAVVWGAQDRADAHCSVAILDPLTGLCADEHCHGMSDDRPRYYDAHHLSEFGNKALIHSFQSLLALGPRSDGTHVESNIASFNFGKGGR